MKKYIVALLLASFLVPAVAEASEAEVAVPLTVFCPPSKALLVRQALS